MNYAQRPEFINYLVYNISEYVKVFGFMYSLNGFVFIFKIYPISNEFIL